MIIKNKALCNKCKDIIESKHVHDFVSCKCGAISVDGGRDYLKRGAKDWNDLIDLSEETEEPPKPGKTIKEEKSEKEGFKWLVNGSWK